MTDKLVMRAAGLDKKKYPGLKMPSPEFNLARLRENKPTGLLSRVERKARVGVDQVIVNELSKPEDEPYAFAVVTMGPGKKFAGIGTLPTAVAEGLDEFTRREFQRERSFWYHAFALVKDFPKPIPMTKPVPGRRFASDVDVRDGKAEPVAGAVDKWDGVPDPFKDEDGKPREPGEYGAFAEPMEKYVAVIPGASSPYRVARLESDELGAAAEEAGELGSLRGLDEVLLAQRVGVTTKKDLPVYKVHGTVVAADDLAEIGRAVEAGDPVRLKGMKTEDIQAVAETLRRFHQAEFEGKPTTVVDSVSREDVLNAYVFVVRELRGRGETVAPKREIDSEAMDLDPGLFSSAVKEPVGEEAMRFLSYDDLREFADEEEVEKGIVAPWGSPGGKRFLAHKIASILPTHRTYIETFAGGAAVFWAKEPSQREVLADIDENLINSFKFIRDCTDRDIAELAKLPTEKSRSVFERLQGETPSSRVGKFHRWVYLRVFSRFSAGENSSFNASDIARKSLQPLVDRMPDLRERLRGVVLRACDWLSVLNEFDASDAVIYLDPPYAGTGVQDFKGGEAPSHEVLRTTLRKIKAKCILSLNKSSEVQTAFKGFHFITVETLNHHTAAKGSKRQEYLISNFSTRRTAQQPLGKTVDDSADLAAEGVEKIGTDPASIKRVIEGAKAAKLRTLKAMPVHEMMEALERFHHKHFDGNDEKSADGISRSAVLSAFRATVLDLIGRGAKLKADNPLAREAGGRWPTLFQKSEEDDDRECAPTHPSGEKQGRRIYLHEVLEKVRPFRFRQDAITIVGGIANRGWTDNDIDVLIKGPLDEDTMHVLKFRLGRMLGPELSQRIQFLSDSEFGGPFTDHVPLGNLMFETLPEFQVKEMRGLPVAKQDDPLQDLPLKPVKRDAVVQLHARGKTVHLDFRIAVRDYLVGFTLPLQRAGAIKDPITTVAQLKAVARNYNVETGNKFLKPMLAPKGLFATPKSRQPLIWLKIEDRVFPPGTAGATKEFPGVVIVIDRPKVEYGQQSPRFHEYFITDSKLKNGLWFVRMLVGEEEEVPEAEVGRVTPAGEIFWKFSISKQFMPSILKPRTVKRKVMPPDGWSWIPQSLERDVPPEFRYWKKKGAEARKIRDALVEARIFTEKTVGLVDGEFRLVRAKRYVVNDGVGVGVVQKQPKRTEYVVSRQSFRGPIVVRAGFSKVFWWLVIDRPGKKGVFAWRVQTDPLGGEARISAVEASAAETRDKALLTLSGDQPPGSKWNPTKATPSDVSPVGDGKVEVLEEKAGFLRLRFTSGPLRGVWSLAAEEPGSLLWELSTVTGPGRPLAAEKAEEPMDEPEPVAGAVPVRDTVQIWDPDKKRPDIDRTDLRPLANFAPMKPREGFFDPNELIDEWATPEIVKAGLDAEPKLNGLRTVAQVDDRGRTFIYFEDSRDDRSKILPGVAAEVKALGEKIGPFILDTELVDFDEDGNAQPRRTLSRFTGPVKPQDDSRVKLMAFRLVYGLGRNWTADPRSDARPALEKFFKKAGRLKHLKILPIKTVKSIDEIPSLIKWASEQPGGEGAMLKMHESTYTLGRFTSSWSKLKITRTVRAIVVEKIPKKPAPEQKVPARTFVYRCAVGPIAKKDLDNFGELVKIKDKWYTKIGKTFATNVQARVGQTLEVQATEFLVDLSVPKKTVHWFTPVVTERVDARPSTFDEVVDAVFEHEIKRPVEKMLDGPVRVLKAEEKSDERFVYGVVLEPETEDSQGDIVSKEEIRKAAHEYMEFYRGIGLMHRQRLFGGARILESYLAPQDLVINGEDVKDGSWLMGLRLVDDAAWADAKAKKLTGFSIQGSAVREPVK